MAVFVALPGCTGQHATEPTALPHTTVASPDGTTPTRPPPRDAITGETALGATPADEQAAMATQLTALVECVDDPRPRAVAHLRWRPARQAEAQRVEVTVRRDGFATGEYDAGPLLDPDIAQVDWTQLHGQAVHLWRVVTLTGEEASTPSDTAAFEAPGCAADYVSQPTDRPWVGDRRRDSETVVTIVRGGRAVRVMEW